MHSDSDSDSVLRRGQKSIFNKSIRISDAGIPQTTLEEIPLDLVGTRNEKNIGLMLRLSQWQRRLCLKLKGIWTAGGKRKQTKG